MWRIELFELIAFLILVKVVIIISYCAALFALINLYTGTFFFSTISIWLALQSNQINV